MANSKLKLNYFDVTGKGEIIRLILHVSGKEFEDNRFSRETQWPEIKPTTPFGQVPTLEIDDKVYAETLAIANFLAREFDLYGKTNLDRLKIDQTAQLWDEFIHTHYGRLYREPEATHEEIHKHLREEQAPRYLGYFEKFLKDNGTGYVVGDSLTMADLLVFDFCTGFLKAYSGDHVDKFPLVKALVEKVGNLGRIKAYRAK